MKDLLIQGLCAWYGPSQVLHDVDMRIGSGEIVGLLGRNGAGRSTLVKAIMGQLRASGSIHYGEEELLGLPPHEIARRGIAYVPESRDVFPAMTVEDNLLLGIQKKRKDGFTLETAYGLFEALARRRHVHAGFLSGGEQQMLSLCRAMMSNPGLILVDEPTEGLSLQMIEVVRQYLAYVSSQGISILLIEQKQTIALQLAQRVYVMGQGKVVFEGTARELRQGTVIKEWLEI